ncbi:cell division protein ZapA [Bradymonas sediminis]|nr:cell division protein ZapA [Bradymonas sediminis]
MDFAGRLGVVSKGSKVSNIDRMGTQTSSDDSVDARASRTTRGVERAPVPRSHNVRIGGQRLSIRTTHEAAFVESLADHIDQKVSELQKMAPSAPLSKLLMLASMTVAEELFDARQEIDRLRDEITECTGTMFSLLDQASSQE